MKLGKLLIGMVVTLASFSLAQENAPKADVIFVHGNIYLGTGSSRAQALAVRGERIQAVGSETEIIALKGPETRVIDLGGKFVMAGFNDAHMHLVDAGFQMLNVNLVGVKSLAEFRERVRAKVAAAAPGEWILGGGWDHTLWPVKETPSRSDLDDISAGHPILLDRTDGHIAIANSRALELAHITKETQAPAGGKIDRDAKGVSTGIVRETAIGLVAAVIPRPTPERRKQAAEVGLRELAKWGVTSAQDNSSDSWESYQTFRELKQEGKLTARIDEWLPFATPVAELQKYRDEAQGDSMLRVGMLKAFMDGSLGSRTAAMLEPFADDPKNSGIPRYKQEELNAMAVERAKAGFQLGFHAIGDRGVQMALDAFAEAGKTSDAHDRRFRIEHAQVTAPGQIERFKQLGLIASMQPCHLLTDMNWAQDRLGERRAAHSYAWAEFLQHGVPLAFGTDFPVEAVNPLRGLYAAVTRKSEDGKREYFPEQKLTIAQAIDAYTRGSAFAEFAEKDKGALASGMLADFIVLDRDLSAIPPAEILKTKVLRTVVGGKTVYSVED